MAKYNISGGSFIGSHVGDSQNEKLEGTMSTGDTNNFTNVQGNINIKSRLDRVVQTAAISAALTTPERDDFSSLVVKLKNALDPMSEANPHGAERVVAQAQIIADELNSEKPNKSFLQVSAEGLKAAAKAVADLAPSVIAVAAEIASFVTGLPLPK